MALSVVIPTTRGGDDLDACLRSLFDQRLDRLEVVVVDNASANRLAGVAERFSEVRIVRNDENLGFVGATIQGVDASTGELVLLLNDDTVVEPGALAALVDALVSRPTWGACQAKLLLLDDPTRLDTAGSFLTATGFLVHRGAFAPAEPFVAADEIFAAKGAALLVRRAALEEVGGLDRDFFAYFEETDLCWRLWLAGWRVGFVPEAPILHKLGATASALPRAFVEYHSYKNRICALLKNLGPTRLAWMLPLHLALCLGIAARYALHRQPRIGLAILRAIAWNATHLGATLRKRHAIQSRRRVPDRELMKRITRPTPVRTLLAYARMSTSDEDVRLPA